MQIIRWSVNIANVFILSMNISSDMIMSFVKAYVIVGGILLIDLKRYT